MADAVIVTLMGEALGQLIHDTPIYLAVGSGLASWDTTTPRPQPAFGQTSLQNELARALATAVYLDSSGQAVAGPTRYVQLSVSFGVGVANGTIREMGLFAYGSATLGSGKLIEAVNFAPIDKAAGVNDFTLTRTMRLTFLG